MVLCTGDTAARCKLSVVSLEYDAIFDEPYATTIGELYAGTTSIPYIKVILIHYQTLSKNDTTRKIDVNNLSVGSLQGFCYYFLINVMTLRIKMKNFATLVSRKF